MTTSDREERERLALVCLGLAGWLGGKTAADLREIAAYLRAPLAREDAATKEEK